MKFGLSDEVIKAIEQVLVSHPEVDQAILYGSRAKGNYKRASDIDLTLVGARLNLDTQFQIENELEELLLPYTFDLSLYGHISQNDLKAHIQRVGKIFYDKTLISS